MDAERVWQSLAEAQLELPAVTGGTGFGRSEGLRVSGKIFAMLVKGELIVKLPRERVDELLDAGAAARFDPGHGRLMKEWAAIPPSTPQRWRSLIEEARAFVGPPPQRARP